jgi:predicted  nucleic acid-binding Zn-ribbon protein
MTHTATLIQNSQDHLKRLEEEAHRLRAARGVATFKVIDLRGKVAALESDIRGINSRLAQILHESAALQQRLHTLSRAAESGADLSLYQMIEIAERYEAQRPSFTEEMAAQLAPKH